MLSTTLSRGNARNGYMKPMTFGQKVQALRLRKKNEARYRRDWSATSCAARGGMKPQQWSDIENDRTRRSDGGPASYHRDTLEALARGLEVPFQTIAEMYWSPSPQGTTAFYIEEGQPTIKIGSGSALNEQTAQALLAAIRKLVSED